MTPVRPPAPSARPVRILSVLWRVLRAVLLGLVAIVIFVEEWGWRPLTVFVARLARWPPLARLESLIARAPPRLALALFLLPATLLFPIKLAALWFVKEGHAAWGVTVIVVAKLVGTALLGRLFILVESQLMQFAWFARALAWWRATQDRIMTAVRGSALWRAARVMSRAARRLLRRSIR